MGANSSKEQMRYILKIADVSIVVCSASILKELVKVLPEIPSIQVVVLMDLAMTYTKVCTIWASCFIHTLHALAACNTIFV